MLEWGYPNRCRLIQYRIAGNASGSAVTEILNDQAGKTGVKFQKGTKNE